MRISDSQYRLDERLHLLWEKGVLMHDSMRMRKSDVNVVFLCSIYIKKLARPTLLLISKTINYLSTRQGRFKMRVSFLLVISAAIGAMGQVTNYYCELSKILYHRPRPKVTSLSIITYANSFIDYQGFK